MFPGLGMPGLGLRLDRKWDPRNGLYMLANVLEDDSLLPDDATWLTRTRALDQGNTGTCVAHAGTGFLLHPPVTQIKAREADTLRWALYRDCMLVDEWTENDSEAGLPDGDPGMEFGTSTLALMKVLKGRGLIDSYLWAFEVDEISRFVRMQGKNYKGRLGGTVIVGTAWLNSMWQPDAQNVLRVVPNSGIAGGHEWLIKGANKSRAMFRMRNSWGIGWGHAGEAYISFESMDWLLKNGGDAVTTNEIQLHQ